MGFLSPHLRQSDPGNSSLPTWTSGPEPEILERLTHKRLSEYLLARQLWPLSRDHMLG